MESDAGGPARPPASRAAALLPEEAVAAGFMVDTVDGRVWLLHDCGNAVRISPTATEAGLRWCVKVHRCGPADSEWHIGTTAQPDRWDPAVSPAHLARRRGRRGLG